MDAFEFSRQIDRLVGVFGPLSPAITEELRARFMGVDAPIWVAICNRIIGSSTYSPRVAAFEAARGAVMAERRLERSQQAVGPVCEKCEGQGFVATYYRLREWPADTFEALAPCRCHPMAGRLASRVPPESVEAITAEQHQAALAAKREPPLV